MKLLERIESKLASWLTEETSQAQSDAHASSEKNFQRMSLNAPLATDDPVMLDLSPKPVPPGPEADFQSVASSAADMAPLAKKQAVEPLPCEDAIPERVLALMRKWPVLDMGFMTTMYHDEVLKRDMPVYAALDCRKTCVQAGYRFIMDEYVKPENYAPVMNPALSPEDWICGQGQPSLYATYRFKGVIPDDVRKVYHDHRTKFDSVHLICDAKNKWSMEPRDSTAASRFSMNPDPLLVGRIAMKDGKSLCFLLAKFDLTPNEQHVLDEFLV